MSKSDYVVIDYHHAWIQKIFQGVGVGGIMVI